jgi:hypothetical protein
MRATFFDEWEIRSGHSLRQKIDQGLEGCTHFIALLTPISLSKPWVKAEMDGAFVRQVAGHCTFIPLRAGITPEELPALLAALHSPAIDDFDANIKQLVADIHGISLKPQLGSPPAVILKRTNQLSLSAAAQAIGRFMVERSEHGLTLDPMLHPDEIRKETGLSDHDIVDGVDELLGDGLIETHVEFPCDKIGFAYITSETELFVKLDEYFMDWNPEQDARLMAADMVNSIKESFDPQELAAKHGWEARRANSAFHYLINRKQHRRGQRVKLGSDHRLQVRHVGERRVAFRLPGGDTLRLDHLGRVDLRLEELGRQILVQPSLHGLRGHGFDYLGFAGKVFDRSAGVVLVPGDVEHHGKPFADQTQESVQRGPVGQGEARPRAQARSKTSAGHQGQRSAPGHRQVRAQVHFQLNSACSSSATVAAPALPAY